MKEQRADLKELAALYEQPGNELVLLYGSMGCRKEDMLRTFMEGKKAFYYRCGQVSAQQQRRQLGEEICAHFDIHSVKHTYDDYFNHIKSGDMSKLLLVIDEAQNVMKRDPEFTESIVRLKMKRLYPGPVMVVLASSSIVWGREAEETFGESYKRVDACLKLSDKNFLELVRTFPSLSVSDCIRIYGSIGGVPGYMEQWKPSRSYRDNICRLVLTEGGGLFSAAEQLLGSELRELSVYNTILSAIASGENKLNDLYKTTGYSRAKISVYLKNLSAFDIVEKVVSFETGGWENAKKGIYRIKHTFVNFWFKFVFPHLSDLYRMEPGAFYDTYIAPELGAYLNRYFQNVCMEYLMLLNQLGRVPFPIRRMGTWVGKTGNIDIIAQSADRRTVVGLCNWEEPQLGAKMCRQMYDTMKKARLTAEHFYLFSATRFEPMLVEHTKTDERFTLIDMNEL